MTTPGYPGQPGAQPPASAAPHHAGPSPSVQPFGAGSDPATLTLRPSKFGWVAAISVGILLLLVMVRPIIFNLMISVVGEFSISAVMSGVLTVLMLLAGLAAGVFGLLGFVGSGRRDAIAFGAGMIGSFEVITIVISYAAQALFSLF